MMKYLITCIITLTICSKAEAFSKIPSKQSTHTRKQLSSSYGMFYPGNNWRAASDVVNLINTSMTGTKDEAPTIWGQEFKVRYESYSWNFIDFRLGVDIQSINDSKLLFTNTLFAVDVVDNLYKRFRHRVMAVGTIAYSTMTKISTAEEELQGTSLKYELTFEWVYALFKYWSIKSSLGYQYQKLGQFPTTIKFDPSYMAIRGVVFSLGINYIL